MEEVRAYKCDFCSRCFVRKCNAAQHEPNCKNNPVMRTCKTCVHGSWRIIEGIGEMERFGAYCDYHDTPVFEKPYFIECDVAQQDYGTEMKVPFSCQGYEYKGKSEWTR